MVNGVTTVADGAFTKIETPKLLEGIRETMASLES